VLAGAAFAAGLVGAISVARGDGSVVRTPTAFVNDNRPDIVLLAHRDLNADDLAVKLDGTKLADGISVRGGRLLIRPDKLNDGKHTVSVKSTGSTWFGAVDEKWSFTVDTKRPTLAIAGMPDPEIVGSQRHVRVRVTTEADAKIQIESRNWKRTVTAVGGANSLLVRLPEGHGSVHFAVRDAAGNERLRSFRTNVDSTAPSVSVAAPNQLSSRDTEIRIGASDASTVRIKATASPGEIPLTVHRSGEHSWRLRFDDALPEGNVLIRVTGTDSVGNEATESRRVVVDTTEELGEAALVRGARGRDVADLHRGLIDKKVVAFDDLGGEHRRNILGPRTIAAVKSFQRTIGVEADGVAGTETIARLVFRIAINREEHTLKLFRLGKSIHEYRVATGSSEFPTPAGEFEIINMQEDPTWTPPNSDWAKGEKPIPPGPDNPLGTRWMGLDSPNVGIHGTNSPTSIGYSVSHGCIRMSIPDVEDLFERVAVGTPVVIV
jgi:peptidoglycan hydrolase-like protein with peptidoglycan-binding domain